MALDPVNVGTIPNDGTGDDPRTGISKVNANMVLLEATGVNGVDNVFTDANLNPNTFGETTGAKKVGIAQDTSTVIFEYQIPTPVKPTGISVVGTFSIVTASSGAVTGGANITPLFSSATSQVGIAILVVFGLSGITSGQNLLMICDSGASKITVN